MIITQQIQPVVKDVGVTRMITAIHWYKLITWMVVLIRICMQRTKEFIMKINWIHLTIHHCWGFFSFVRKNNLTINNDHNWNFSPSPILTTDSSLHCHNVCQTKEDKSSVIKLACAALLCFLFMVCSFICNRKILTLMLILDCWNCRWILSR